MGKKMRSESVLGWFRLVLGLLSVAGMASVGGCTGGELGKSMALLPIPEALVGRKEGEIRVFDLELRTGEKEFLAGKKTATWGINGAYLGPTIRVKKGESIEMRVKNALPEDTTIHWHGLHIPAAMDGGPHQMIRAGEVWKPTFPVVQRASLNWYHPHPHGKTGEHVYKGLAGMFWIEDEISEALDLPKEYGVDDIPIILQDRNFHEDGSFKYISGHMEQMVGVKGRHLLVNGVIAPTFHAKAQFLRLRLLNGSHGRIYNLGFEGNRRFYLIATEGGLLEAPVPLTRLLLASGERAEVVIDLSQEAGKTLSLQSFSSETLHLIDKDDPKGGMHADPLDSTDFPMMTIAVSKPATATRPLSLPSKLAPVSPPLETEAQKTRMFVLDIKGAMGTKQDFTINDAMMDMSRIDFEVKQKATEIWEIKNVSDMPHPFHIHGISFFILDRKGKTPPDHEKGWKDTVLVHFNESVRLIAKFDLQPDPKIPYMYHCHILEHEDAGMMGQFAVVE